MAKRKLEIVLAGDAKGAVQAFGEAERRSDSFGGKMLSVGKVAAAAFAAVGAAAVGVGVGLAKVGATFDAQYDKIRVGTGATGDALKALKGDFKAVVSSVPTDFDSAGTAVADLNTRLGLTGPLLQERAAQFLELSRITETDLGGNIANLTRVFGDWDVATEDQAATLDKVFRASQSTGAGIEQLSSQVVQFGAPLRQLGFSLDESLAILGKFEKEGVNTELVLGSMRQALGRMARAGEEPIATFKRVTGEIKSVGSAGEANALALELFGARAGPDMAAAIREGRFELGDLLTTISDGSETIMKAGADTQDFSEKWQMFKNQVLVKLEPIAMRAFDALSGLFDLVVNRDFTKTFADAFNVAEDSPVVDMLFRIRDAIVGVGPKIVAFGRETVAAIGNVVASIRQWLTENQATIDQWRVRLSSIFANVWAVISGFVQLVQVVWGIFGQTILSSAKRAFDAIFRVIDGVLRVIKGVLDVFIGVFTGDWSRAWEGVKGITSGAWAAIKGMFSLALEAVRLVVSLMWDKIKAIFGGAFQFLKDQVHAGLLTIKQKFLDWAGSLVGAAATAFGWVPGIGPKLREARDRIRQFREETNREIAQIKNKTVTITVSRIVNEHVNARRGDGPGGPGAPRGGKALARVQSIIGAYPGLRITNTYRTPEHNRRVGGSPTSYHMDRNNPAVDIGGPTWQLDRFNAALGSGWREKLWRVKGHYDHVHVAHAGGVVDSSWPTVPGLAADERPAVLQVGETVVPRGTGAANWTEVSRQASRMGEDMLEALIGGVEIGSRGLPSTFAGVGTDVTTGLAGGLRAGEGTVWSAMSMFSQGMPMKVKDQLGISSPSSVFHGYGHSVGVGYANGINAAIPQVTAAYAAMMRASGMVQAEDGSWVPRSFYSKRNAARAHHHHPRRTAPPNDDSFASNSYYSRNRGKPGAIQAEDGSWVMPSFYGRRAHTGGIVSPSWPTLEGLRGDERPAILQVGEQVVPKGKAGGGDTHIHYHIGTFVGSDERAFVELAQRAKRKGYVGV